MAAERQNSAGITTSGRSHLPTADKVFDRLATLPVPGKRGHLPLYQTDEIPKDVFFPFDEDAVAAVFGKLPAAETQGVTHLWLRRPKASEFRSGRIPLAEYIALDDFAAVIFYPWPVSLRIPIAKKPGDKILNRYRRWRPNPVSHKGKWHLEWLEEHAADFCVSDLIRQMVAVHTEFRARHAAREVKRGEEVPIAYANQRYFEENLEIW